MCYFDITYFFMSWITSKLTLELNNKNYEKQVKKVMVNNSTNINKITTNFHLKPLNTKKMMKYGIGNPGLDLGQAQ